MKQKALDKDESLVDGEFHNGVHFPLAAFTHNASGRCADAVKRRQEKSNERKGKGKGKGHRTENGTSNEYDPQSREPPGAASYYHNMPASSNTWTTASWQR